MEFLLMTFLMTESRLPIWHKAEIQTKKRNEKEINPKEYLSFHLSLRFLLLYHIIECPTINN